MKFNSRYSVTGEKPGIKFDQPSQTLQSFKDDADINCIIARFEHTGVLVDPTVPVSRVPQFGASSGGSYENLGTAATSGYMAAQQAKNLEMQNEAIKATVEKTRAEASNVLQDTKLKSAQTSQVQGETTLIPLRAENISTLTAQAKPPSTGAEVCGTR
jgi:hypothetical protein